MVPALHMGRLAVDLSMQGRRLGEALVMDAPRHAVGVADGVGVNCLDVWALNERVRTFYERFEFRALLDDPLHLFLPMAVIRKLVSEGN